MKVHKFVGANSREALREVKRELGPDAAILSNRAVPNGVEITAMASSALAAMSEPQPAAVAAPAESAKTEPAPPPAERKEQWFEAMMTEIKSLRGVLEDQLGGVIWGDLQRREPVRARLLRDLLHSGFSPALARLLVDKLPAGSSHELAEKWLLAALGRNLNCAREDDIVSRGGVYALMGPTGVGKTTTTAKLAARCVVRHGAERLALLTTDSYRVGAHEQLRIYGKILGVAVHAIRDAEDLQLALAELKNKHLVLIDTVGMSQRDQMVAEQVAMLSGGPVHRLLLINAASSSANLDDVVQSYLGAGLHGAILTKVDEAVTLGAPLDVMIRRKLTLHYVANGQRVPEDLHPVQRDLLLERAIRASTAGALKLSDAEIPALLGSATARPVMAGLGGA